MKNDALTEVANMEHVSIVKVSWSRSGTLLLNVHAVPNDYIIDVISAILQLKDQMM